MNARPDQLTLGIWPRGSLRETLDWYVNRCTDGLSAEYIAKRRAEVEWLCAFFGAGMLVAELDYERLLYFVRRGKERGHAPTTVKTRLDLLKAALREAVKRKIIPTLPHWPLLRDTRARRTKRVPTRAEYEAVRLVVPEHRRDWYDWAFWTGMREDDLDETRRFMLDMKSAEWLRRSTKTRAAPAIFPLPPRLHEIMIVSLGLRPRAEADRLLGIWTHGNAARDLRRYCDRAGVPKFTPTDLRRACRARLVAEGHPPTYIELWMCHSDKVAKKHYDAMNEDARAEMRARMR